MSLNIKRGPGKTRLDRDTEWMRRQGKRSKTMQAIHAARPMKIAPLPRLKCLENLNAEGS